jgi:outer membrane lipopolysaccharide assembly protein LptE/RlpB
MISGENQQKMTGKSAERAEISAEMRVFLNSAQKIRRTGIFAERRTAQNEKSRNLCWFCDYM